MEIWKDIQGYEGIYQVSNEGRVRSLDKLVLSKGGSESLRKGKILKPYVNHAGYLRVTLQNNGIIKTYPLHYLVIKTFVGERPANMQINHKDENKANNFVFVNDDGSVDFEKSNLEYCTPSYNCNYGDRTEKIKQKNQKPVIALNAEGMIVLRFNSAKDAEEKGFSSTHICSCCKGKRKWHKGLFWKYE